jgi:hypothetical protein
MRLIKAYWMKAWMSRKGKRQTSAFFFSCWHALYDDYLSGTDDSNWHMHRHVSYCHDELIRGCSFPSIFLLLRWRTKFLFNNYRLMSINTFLLALDEKDKWVCVCVCVYMRLFILHSFRCSVCWSIDHKSRKKNRNLYWATKSCFIRIKIIIMNKRWQMKDKSSSVFFSS